MKESNSELKDMAAREHGYSFGRPEGHGHKGMSAKEWSEQRNRLPDVSLEESRKASQARFDEQYKDDPDFRKMIDTARKNHDEEITFINDLQNMNMTTLLNSHDPSKFTDRHIQCLYEEIASKNSLSDAVLFAEKFQDRISPHKLENILNNVKKSNDHQAKSELAKKFPTMMSGIDKFKETVRGIGENFKNLFAKKEGEGPIMEV